MSQEKESIKTINDIEIKEPENRNEKLYFSIIKHLAEEIGFGELDLTLKVKNNKIVNVAVNSGRKNFNVGG